MSFHRQFISNYQSLWSQYQQALIRKVTLKFSSEGIKFHWSEFMTPTPLGVLKTVRPVIDYVDPGKARTLGSVSYDPYHYFKKIEDELELEFYAKVQDSATSLVGSELAQHFDITELSKVLKRLGIIEKSVAQLNEVRSKLLTTGQAQTYTLEAQFFRRRTAWQLRMTKGGAG